MRKTKKPNAVLSNRIRFTNGETVSYKGEDIQYYSDEIGDYNGFVKHVESGLVYQVLIVGRTNVEIYRIIMGVMHEVVIPFREMVFKTEAKA